MNVKITETSVTFKITEDELGVLAAGENLETLLPIGCNDFAMVINVNSSQCPENCRNHPLKLILDKDESCLTLCTSEEQISRLVDMGRSKQGLFAHVGGVDVFLQVDLRADSRPRKKG